MKTQTKSPLNNFRIFLAASLCQRSCRTVGGLVVLLAGLHLSRSVQAADIVWTNTAGGNWSSTNNWSPNQVPGASDTAWITNNGTYTVTLNASATVASLTLGGTSGTQSFVVNANNTLTLNGASTVGSNGAFNLARGTLGGTGSFTVNGPFTWSSGYINNTGGVTLNGTSSLNGAGNNSMQLSGLLINAGTLTWSGSGANLWISGTLTNLAAGTITITADVSSAAGGTIGNAGLLRKTGATGTTTLSAAFVNTGDVQVQSGTVDLIGGGSASGTFEVSANATLQFGAGTYTLSSASSVTGAGTVLMSSGTVNSSGTFSLSGTNTISGGILAVNSPGSMAVTNLNLSGGNLNGNAPVAVNGPFGWSSGHINNTGGVTLNGTSSLNGVGYAAMQLYGLLINAGALTWSGSGANLYISGGTLTNLASGTITISADVSSASSGTIGNAGLLSKTGATGTTTLNTAFVNTGDVQANSGTVSFGGAFIQNAGQTVLNGGNFAFSQGAQFRGGALNGTGTITGSVSNNAAIGTGSSPGLLTISGNYTEGPNAHLAIKLGGNTAGTNYDQLSIGGSAALAGSLDISYWNGFTPSAANFFTVLACNARTGGFSAITAPTNNLGTVYTAKTVLVESGNASPIAQLTVPAQSLAGHNFVVKGSGTDLDGTVTNLTLLFGTNVLVSVPGSSAQVNFSSDFPGNLTFTALATDNGGAQGATNTTVTITTLPLLTLDAVGFQANHVFKLCMLGVTGTNYQVLASTNLTVPGWTILGTMESTNGIWRFLDTAATNSSRFYQAKQLP